MSASNGENIVLHLFWKGTNEYRRGIVFQFGTITVVSYKFMQRLFGLVFRIYGFFQS